MNAQRYLDKIRAGGDLLEQLKVQADEYLGPGGQSMTAMESASIHRKTLLDAKAEITRLQAIVDKLPKTADGVPVVPGMDVWVDPNSPHCCLVAHVRSDKAIAINFHGNPYATIQTNKDAFSCREAAEAAREEGDA